jgi:hypothetical protein
MPYQTSVFKLILPEVTIPVSLMNTAISEELACAAEDSGAKDRPALELC